MVYLDNNATTPLDPAVIEKMAWFMGGHFGNPSSLYPIGREVKNLINEARAHVAAAVGAAKASIYFTGSGTESDNQAILGVIDALPDKREFVTTTIEHPAVSQTAAYLEGKGYKVTYVPVDATGTIDLDALRSAVTPQTALVSVMHANNETGVLFQMEEIAQIVKSAGAVLHTDAVQAVGKVPVDVRRVPVDMLSFAGHKLHAPKGIGVLYIRRGTRLKTYMVGGHQEHGRRGGTENVPYIVGLACACDLAREHLAESGAVAVLRDRLENGLLATCPDASVNGDRTHRVPNTTNMSFSLIEGEAILYHLSDLGICASSGSACSSGSLEPSHVIRAMGIPFTAAHGSIRFSLSRYTTAREIDYVLEHMPRIVAKLRAMSPFVK